MNEFLKKIDLKSGLLYFVLIECQILVVSLFLAGFMVMPVRFIIKEPGMMRETVEFFVFLLFELLVRFVIFYGLFKNSRNLTYKQFCTNYIVTFIIRYVFSLFTSFAVFSAGMSITLLGTLLGRVLIDETITTMQDVPAIFYTVIFILIEALTLLVVYLPSKLTARKREKARQELLKEYNPYK